MRFFVLSFLLACQADNEKNISQEDVNLDSDGDGFVEDEDCNDRDASIYPQATEVCDGIDNNCNQEIDEGVLELFYADSDEDGFGAPDIVVEACAILDGFVTTGNDCDDTRAEAYPGAEEICDGIDNNCDEQVDEGLSLDFYVDSDGDGFGDDNEIVSSCSQYLGLSTLGGDCDDADASISPLAGEACDGIDNNCDGVVDEGVQIVFYRDFDGDGFGDDATTIESCEEVEGYISRGGDCDDTEIYAHPSAIEICDGVDNDCDEDIDEEGSSGSQYYYLDNDDDGYGDPNTSSFVCSAPLGYVSDNTDCDDALDSIYPSAPEYCNGADDDCDEDIDEDSALDVLVWYADADGDGYGTLGASQEACAQPSGFVLDSSDCNDSSSISYPSAVEVCDEIDNNCDGVVDEGVKNTYYTDIDGDGYGSSLSIESCAQPTGFVLQSGDCNDEEELQSPAQTELCDNLDNNCDGVIDDGLLETWYADTDGDGYGDTNSNQEACVQPTGFVADASDCDDQDATSHPSAVEVCDGIDNNCDFVVDDDVLGTANTCPGIQCQDILDSSPSATDGAYWIQPDTSMPPFQAWCDMSTDDGGWTLLITLDPSTVTFATVEDWPDQPDVTGGAPTSSGLYKGSLSEFSEVREEISSGSVVAYGSGLSESSLNVIRQLYGYNSRLVAAPTLDDPPDCSLTYGAVPDIVGCSRYSHSNNTTIIGWAVDPNSTYSSHCWFARGNCCSTSGGSAQCIGDPNGTLWARTWFR